MAGLAGWSGMRVDSADAVSGAMSNALARHDGSRVDVQRGESFAVHAARPKGVATVCAIGDGPVAGALYGDIRGALATDDSKALLQRLCRAYADGDTSFLTDLEGVFALALLDPAAGRALVLADRVGMVPLYYWHSGSGLGFSTTLPAMYALPDLPTVIDYQAIYSYLYFHAIPSPQTIYGAIRRLRPGAALELKAGRVSETTYWQPIYREERSGAGVTELKPEFRSTIESSVRNELGLGDAVGCFLSGGTDSSTVAGHLAKLSDAKARSFSIGFDEEGYDETEFARIASRHFATDHTEYYVTPADIVDLVPKIADYYGTPFGNSSVIPTYYCARLAREQGIDRILGGDGGDELFGGNERYAKQKVFGLYDGVPAWFKGALLEPLVNGFPLGEKIMPIRKARRYIEQAKVAMPGRMETYNLMHWFRGQGLLDPAFEAVIDDGAPLRQLAEVYDGAQAGTMMNRMLAMDLKFTLADNDIPKVNGMCELAGIEVGFPFMSDDMVDFASRVPIDMKVKRLRLRHFFKEALRDFLPPKVISKSKHGFGLPFGRWAVTDPRLRDLSMDSLTDFKTRGIVQPAFIDRLIDESRGEDAHYVGTLVWVFMILEQWFAGSHARRIAAATSER